MEKIFTEDRAWTKISIWTPDIQPAEPPFYTRSKLEWLTLGKKETIISKYPGSAVGQAVGQHSCARTLCALTSASKGWGAYPSPSEQSPLQEATPRAPLVVWVLHVDSQRSWAAPPTTPWVRYSYSFLKEWNNPKGLTALGLQTRWSQHIRLFSTPRLQERKPERKRQTSKQGLLGEFGERISQGLAGLLSAACNQRNQELQDAKGTEREGAKTASLRNSSALFPALFGHASPKPGPSF